MLSLDKDIFGTLFSSWIGNETGTYIVLLVLCILWGICLGEQFKC